MQEGNTTPKALVLFKMDRKRREVPTLYVMQEGDNADAKVIELLGGAADREVEVDEFGRHLGVLRMAQRGDWEVHVHSDPEAEFHLSRLISNLEAELQIINLLKQAGIVTEREDGCICGQCPLPGESDEPGRTVH